MATVGGLTLVSLLFGGLFYLWAMYTPKRHRKPGEAFWTWDPDFLMNSVAIMFGLSMAGLILDSCFGALQS